VQRWCRETEARCENEALPAAVVRLAAELLRARDAYVPVDHSRNFFTTVGLTATEVWRQAREFYRFHRRMHAERDGAGPAPRRFRWRDCFYEMQQCGAMAVPIVGLSSFLVGLTLAYTGAIILRQFGGDIWVADIVGLSMFRESGAVLTAIVLAGRTGAATPPRSAT